MANERYSSWLIDEGESRQITYASLGRSLATAGLLTILGVVVVWSLFLLLATA